MTSKNSTIFCMRRQPIHISSSDWAPLAYSLIFLMKEKVDGV